MRQTILIVDDCIDIARIIERHLASAAYRTVTVTSGAAARRVLAGARPDCIVLDLMMPGVSGAELLHELRSDPATHAIPVVLVSARFGFGGANLSADVDADANVGKPFTKEQIVRAVSTVLAGKSAPAIAA